MIGKYRDILDRCMARMEMGEKKYGKYDPSSDTRDLLKETSEELLDAINYLHMHSIKVNSNKFDRLISTLCDSIFFLEGEDNMEVNKQHG